MSTVHLKNRIVDALSKHSALRSTDLRSLTGASGNNFGDAMHDLITSGLVQKVRRAPSAERRAGFDFVLVTQPPSKEPPMNSPNGTASHARDAERSGPRAIVLVGSLDMYRKNDLPAKIAKLGVLVEREQVIHDGAVPSVDFTRYDAIIFIDDVAGGKIAHAIRRHGQQIDKPVFGLTLHRSHPSWQALSMFASTFSATAAPISNSPSRDGSRSPRAPFNPALPGGTYRIDDAAPDLGPKLTGAVAMGHYVDTDGPPSPANGSSAARSVAKTIEDNEELTRLALLGEEQAKARLAAALREVDDLKIEVEALKKTGGVVVREQLTADVARKEGERKAAVAELERVRAEMTARLEAAERERRDEVAALKNSTVSIVEVLRAGGWTANKGTAGEVLQFIGAQMTQMMSLLSEVDHLRKLVAESRINAAGAAPAPSYKKISAIIAAVAADVLTPAEGLAKIESIAKAEGASS